MKEIIKLGYAKFWVAPEKILHCQFNNSNPEYRLDTKKVKTYIETISTLCNGKSMPFLIDLRNARGTFSTNAANLLSKSPLLREIRVAEAFVYNSMSMELLISSYKRIYDPITPFALFKDPEAAKNYCLNKRKPFNGNH